MLRIRDFSTKRPTSKVLHGVRFSAAISALYYKDLKKLLDWIHKEFIKTVFDGLDTKQMTSKLVKDESPNERYKKRLAEFNKVLRGKLSRKAIEKLVRRSLNKAASYSQRDFDRKLKSFGIDLSKGQSVIKKYSSYMSTVVEENVLLVKDLTDEQSKRLQSVVLRGMREGIAISRTAGDVQRALGVAKRRAVLIARTETHKLTQQLADRRAEDAGLTRGVWRAVMDNRTSSQHARFNGKSFDIKKGLWDPKTRSWNWPGRRPNCRCWTDYIIGD